ncbi:MAG: TetR/AcrR family transcriptional regulator, partial [Bacilli bacterium]
MNEDIRTLKTYKALETALFSELKEKSFEEIKIVDLCKKANIHRTTFYSHFNDKYELLEYSIKNLQKDLESNITNTKIYINIKEYYLNLISIFLDNYSYQNIFPLS